jgi:prepilin-type N-terminal cleavage/methylation domain-containing protein
MFVGAWTPDTLKMRKAFSIAELMIVAAVIGILAALLMPSLHNHAMEAKEAAAREDLQLLRGAIELYAARHAGVPPGYPDNTLSSTPTADCFQNQTTVLDRCLLQTPENPFNNLNRVRIVGNEEGFPGQATGHDGWIYQPATKNIRVDWPGSDTHGIRYFDY